MGIISRVILKIEEHACRTPIEINIEFHSLFLIRLHKDTYSACKKTICLVSNYSNE
jgi:hypothetical protein